MTINYGLIGCGMMGMEHVRNIQLLPNTKVVAIFEPDPHMRQQVRELVPDALLVDSLDELLTVETLSCLVIASPNHLHVEQLETIAAQRALPTLCEKPLFTANDDLSRVQALNATFPAPIWVAMEYRYMPPIARFIDCVDTITGGTKMLTITEHRFPFLQKVNNWNRFNAQSGGTLVEKCCHFFDLMRLILKDDPVRVMASAGQEVNHLDETYHGQQSDIWDTGYVIIDFAKGARACLELSMYAEGSRYQEMMHAVGPEGKIECKVPGPDRFWPDHLGEPPVPVVVESPRHPKGPVETLVPVDKELLSAGDHHGSTFYQHQKFLEVVQGKAQPEVTLEDGIWAVRIGQAAQRSAREGCAVTL